MTIGTIALVGSESAGKSRLAATLARRLVRPWVPEAARLFYDRHGPQVAPSDLKPIAALHAELVRAAGPGPLILDTDLLTILVWAEVLHGAAPRWLGAAARAQDVPFTLVLGCDLPWTPDPQRCQPDLAARRAFRRRLCELLTAWGRPWTPVQGSGGRRQRRALAALARLGRQARRPECRACSRLPAWTPSLPDQDCAPT